MQELTHKTEPQAASMEESYQGISMAPPAFQLMASPVGKLEGDTSAEGGEGEYTADVANFERIIFEIHNANDTQNIRGLVNALEPLKHDRAQVSHFLEYFQRKYHYTLYEDLRGQWSDHAAETAASVLGSFSGGEDQLDAEAKLFKSIAEKNYREIFSDLSLVADIEGASKRYGEVNPGKDLYSDLMTLAHPSNGLEEYANKVFGKVQSGEKVTVRNAEEAREASEIISRVYSKYGVDINSQASLDSLMKWAENAPEDVKVNIAVSNWTVSELREIEKALIKFSPFMGAERSQTGLKNVPQEVNSIGKLNKAIGYSKTGHYYESETFGGEYFEELKNISLYDNMDDEDFEQRYNDNGKNETTAAGNVMTHELAHGLLSELLPKWPEVSNGYWKNQVVANNESTFKTLINGIETEFIKSEVKGSEAPPTEYGTSNANEDLAESVTLYLNNPSQLLSGSPEWQRLFRTYRTHGIVGNACPRRYRVLDQFFKKMNHSE